MGVSVSIAILAGGASSRFAGVDKQELPFLGSMLGTRVARQALSTGQPVTIIGQNRKPYVDLPLGFAADTIPGFGPLSGLHAALLESTCDYVYLIACDMPGFSETWYEKLRSLADSEPGFDAILAKSREGLQPFHALYSRRLVSVLEAAFTRAAASGEKISFARALDGASCYFIEEAESLGITLGGSIFLGINNPQEAEYLEREYFLRRH